MISSPQTMPGGNAPLLPSFEEQDSPQDRILLNPKTRRIRWTLDGPLETAIAVARDFFFDPDEVPEPYYQGVSGSSGKPTWHPFAHSPLTKPKVSSVKLFIDPLDTWDYYWMEVHEDHTDPDELHDPADVVYGPMPSVDETKRTESDSYFLKCCGSKRPWDQGTTDLIVKATGDSGFVTIYDFISTVHPYLMARRSDIIEAINVDPARGGKHFGPETKLMVRWHRANDISVTDEADWMDLYTRNRPKPYSGGLPPSVLHAISLDAQEQRKKFAMTEEQAWESEEE